MERKRGVCEEGLGGGAGLRILTGQKANGKSGAVWERKLWGEGRDGKRSHRGDSGVDIRTEAKAGWGWGQTSGGGLALGARPEVERRAIGRGQVFRRQIRSWQS